MVSKLDYPDVMAEIAALMDRNAVPGTADGDRLRDLVAIARAYERERYRRTPLDPITAIRFRMEQAGLEPRHLIPYLGSRSRVSEVLSGKRPLTLQMIRNLHRGLGIPAESLIAEPASLNEGSDDVDWTAFPIAEMNQRGWIRTAGMDLPGRIDALKRYLSPVLSAGFGSVLFRKSTTAHVRVGQSPDWYALVAWTARVAERAEEHPLTVEFRAGSVSKEFLSWLARTSWSERGPSVAAELLQDKGIAVVVEPQLPGTRLDGAAIWMPGSRPVIALTLRFDRLDSFWYTIMHELAHLSQHLKGDVRACYDDLEAMGEDEMEREADQIARDALIPPELDIEPVMKNPSPFLVKDLAHRLGIHPAIIAGRVRHDLDNYRLLSRLVGQGEVSHLFLHTG